MTKPTPRTSIQELASAVYNSLCELDGHRTFGAYFSSEAGLAKQAVHCEQLLKNIDYSDVPHYALEAKQQQEKRLKNKAKLYKIAPNLAELLKEMSEGKWVDSPKSRMLLKQGFALVQLLYHEQVDELVDVTDKDYSKPEVDSISERDFHSLKLEGDGAVNVPEPGETTFQESEDEDNVEERKMAHEDGVLAQDAWSDYKALMHKYESLMGALKITILKPGFGR